MNRRQFLAGLAASAVAPAPWRNVADRLITTPVESYPFNWGEGVQQMGLMRAWERTRDDRYLDWMERWTAQFLARDIRELLNQVRAGYCGHWSPATAIRLLHAARPKPEYLRLSDQVIRFIDNEAERSGEGALGHWQGSHQLWVDTLYMACPLLALTRDAKHVAGAAQQIVIYAKHLQDVRGLFFHMWDWQTRERSQGAWGRGNGWVLMSLADTMEAIEPSDPQWQPLKRIATNLAGGVKATQNREGLWHTVMDDPSSYPETSASAMFCYGLLKLSRLKVLPAEVTAITKPAWNTLNERYVHDGVVTGVSAGTEPKGTGHYKDRPLGTQTWGTGAYLLAASEVARME